MGVKSAIEQDIVEEIECKRSLEPGDFARVLDAFWMMLKYLITSDRGFFIHIPKVGIFKPRYKSVDKAIRREIKRLRSGIGSRDKLYYLFGLRRKLIRLGEAPKSYYLRKQIIHGRTEGERRRAEDTLRVLQGRCGRLNKAFTERKREEREVARRKLFARG